MVRPAARMTTEHDTARALIPARLTQASGQVKQYLVCSRKRRKGVTRMNNGSRRPFVHPDKTLSLVRLAHWLANSGLLCLIIGSTPKFWHKTPYPLSASSPKESTRVASSRFRCAGYGARGRRPTKDSGLV